MKKLILILALIPLLFKGQIEMQGKPNDIKIGECKDGSRFNSSITKMESGNYILMFRNMQYDQILDLKSIVFTEEETLNTLYDLMMSVFKDENKKNENYSVNFKLGDTDCSVSTIRVMGITNCTFKGKGGYFYTNEKKINKLFGKK